MATPTHPLRPLAILKNKQCTNRGLKCSCELHFFFFFLLVFGTISLHEDSNSICQPAHVLCHQLVLVGGGCNLYTLDNCFAGKKPPTVSSFCILFKGRLDRIGLQQSKNSWERRYTELQKSIHSLPGNCTKIQVQLKKRIMAGQKLAS